MARETARTSRTDDASGVGVRAEVAVDDPSLLLAIAGPNNSLLKVLGEELQIDVGLRGNSFLLAGDADGVGLAERFVAEAAAYLRGGARLDAADLSRAIRSMQRDGSVRLRDLFDDVVLVTPRNRTIAPKSLAQRKYIQAIREHDLTFCIGPAGTGKTYLAMAMAVQGLLARAYKRIVLARPAVEAGEKLGFLPGDLAEKVNPYLRPLYDALHDMMDIDRADGMVARGQIEVAPLAFMRGRTLNDSFVILDEAQNATSEQMRMFLTRLGYASKAVVTGDVTQVDLPGSTKSGLGEARELLSNVDGIAFCPLTEVDVVRHPLVQKIIVAYEKRDRERKEADARAQEAREARLAAGAASPPRGGAT